MVLGNSLVIQWLGFCSSNAGSMSMISGQESKIPQAVLHAPPQKKKERENLFIYPGKMGPLRFHQESEGNSNKHLIYATFSWLLFTYFTSFKPHTNPEIRFLFL